MTACKIKRRECTLKITISPLNSAKCSTFHTANIDEYLAIVSFVSCSLPLTFVICYFLFSLVCYIIVHGILSFLNIAPDMDNSRGSKLQLGVLLHCFVDSVLQISVIFLNLKIKKS